MISTKDELFKVIKGPGAESASSIDIQRARVASFDDDGYPLLEFEGEGAASPKKYVKMRHYDDPQEGDRVLLINDIIIGTWTKRESRGG